MEFGRRKCCIVEEEPCNLPEFNDFIIGQQIMDGTR
jgi:hypothetical protein